MKFLPAFIRLTLATNSTALLIADNLNRHYYEILKKDPATAQILAIESGTQ